MSSPPILGHTADGRPLEVDVARLIGSHAGVVANSGGGKSGLIRRLLEVTQGHVQQIVLDPEDEFYTLRERFDYVIAGGEGGDVPATLANAETLALGALTHGFSLIAQLNDLGFDGAPAFIGRFLTALVNAPRDLWHPVLVVVDEAQRSVPRVGATEATEGVKDLISRGRKRGFTAVLAAPKFTEIDPAVRGSINNWLLGRVGQAVDRRTMADQLGFSDREGREKLRGIETRWFWAFGPALCREPTLFRVDDVETTHIHAGQAKVPTPPPAEALRKILQGLTPPTEPERATSVEPDAPFDAGAEVGEAVREKQARIDELGARNWELIGERDRLAEELKDARGREDRARTEAVGVAIELQAAAWRARRLAELLGGTVEVRDNIGGSVVAAHSKQIAGSAAEATPRPRRQPRAGEGEARTVPERPNSASPEVAPAEGCDVHLPPRRLRILGAINWTSIYLKRPRAPRSIVAYIAGTTPTSSTFVKDLGAMRAQGIVDYPDEGHVALTREGAALAEPLAIPQTRTELWDAIASKLPPRRVKILGALWHRPALDRAQLAHLCGTTETSSTFVKDLGAMKARGLIDYPSKGMVELAPLYRESGDA